MLLDVVDPAALDGTRTVLITKLEYQGTESMTDLEKALASQIANIVKRTGESIPELAVIVTDGGLSKHGELVAMLKSKLGKGHGATLKLWCTR